MTTDFLQHKWSGEIEESLRRLIELAIWEDMREYGDITSQALIPANVLGRASVVARQDGILAGGNAIPIILQRLDERLRFYSFTMDGSPISKGTNIGDIEGPVRGILAAERIILNLIGRLTGIATLTKRYVDAISGTKTEIYDTRKTTLGWRLLEKYAVQCGGGRNHRTGLFDAVLIKDNHLAYGGAAIEPNYFAPSGAIIKAREYLAQTDRPLFVEIEVDSTEQLFELIVKRPDVVLLDNMNRWQLLESVLIRNSASPETKLEASGGVNLSTVREIAETGVDRISVGALTHSAVSHDFGLDWV